MLLKKNYFIFLCFMMLFLGLSLGLNNLTSMKMWMSMEMTLLSFVPCFIMNKSIIESYSSLKYFIFQCLGSSMFLLGMLEYFNIEVLIFGLMIKLGFFPMQFWVVSVCKGLNWMTFFILMTFQKILPLFFLLLFLPNIFILLFIFLLLNSMMGNIMSINQYELRSLMVFSSLNHMSWMFFCKMLSWMFFYIYFFLYSVMLLMLCIFFFLKNIYFFNQLFYINMYTYMLMFIMIIFLSFLGFPPFLGFFLKLISISSMNFAFFFIMMVLLLNLLISFSYVRVFFFFFNYNYNSILKIKILKKHFFFLLYMVFFIM
uniref:NADH-ubiquinone oxidoreductase chain 2 n=1 Tax=Elaphrothrips spiniceps TaxID=3003602 RepID=A0AA50LTF5_9NEOP|nr:NADH dehydrogenase subunit 2 [Elaphrothrips spiniceps]